MQSDLDFVPQGKKTINFILSIKDVAKGIEFYNSAFSAEPLLKLHDTEGKILHAEMKMIDTIIILKEEDYDIDRVPSSTFQVYVEDVEAVVEDAIRAGAILLEPIKKRFYGDRNARIKDPFGHEWVISTHEDDLTFDELQKRFNQTLQEIKM